MRAISGYTGARIFSTKQGAEDYLRREKDYCGVKQDKVYQITSIQEIWNTPFTNLAE